MKLKESETWIWDIETFNNVFTFCAVRDDKLKGVFYEISARKNELSKLIKFLKRLKFIRATMVGFNSLGFDYPVVHWIYEKVRVAHETNTLDSLVITARLIHDYAQEIIEKASENRFAVIVPTRDRHIRQIDLYKIHHFDNRARACSLKMIEFNMRCETIEDLPFNHWENVSNDDIEYKVKSYNKHDVMRTLDFYHASLDKIQFRENISAKYGFDVTNFNDTKIGKEYFVKKLEEKKPGCCYIQTPKGRKLRQTKRSIIHLRECIFPYIQFERPEFQALLEWFKNQSITETKGVFTDLYEWQLGDVAQYAELIEKKKKLPDKPTEDEIKRLQKEIPMSWVEEVPLKAKGKFSYYHKWRIADALNVSINGLTYYLGTGGLHASVQSQSVYSTDEMLLIDQDVSSYYPNMAISNRIYPEHLGEAFCDIYKEIYDERKQYDKKTAENLAMKLALNGSYGASNDEYSPLYDPKFTMSITVGGQLSLLMLVEQALKIEGLQIIQCNTDGVTFYCPRNKVDELTTTIKWWETTTKLEMERNDYSAMHIRDVNSYVAVYAGKDEVKRKGAYEYANLDWPKNQSALVVKKAAEHQLLGRGTVEEFIRQHGDIFDFMLRVKIPKNSRLVLVNDFGEEIAQQNTCRYYVSNGGGSLIKIMPPLESQDKTCVVMLNAETQEEMEYISKSDFTKAAKKGFTEKVREYIIPAEERRSEVEAGWKVTTCNNMKSFAGNINFDYYIERAQKLVQFQIEEETLDINNTNS